MLFDLILFDTVLSKPALAMSPCPEEEETATEVTFLLCCLSFFPTVRVFEPASKVLTITSLSTPPVTTNPPPTAKDVMPCSSNKV